MSGKSDQNPRLQLYGFVKIRSMKTKFLQLLFRTHTHTLHKSINSESVIPLEIGG